MAITEQDNEEYLEKLELRIRELSMSGSIRRTAHTGATTSREIEFFQGMSVADLHREVARVKRMMGKGCSRRPMYP